jgi:hypothetical protein
VRCPEETHRSGKLCHTLNLEGSLIAGRSSFARASALELPGEKEERSYLTYSHSLGSGFVRGGERIRQQ